MSDVNFRMGGSGNWQKFFPSEVFYLLYERIYPEGVNLKKLNESDRDIIYQWDKVAFVEVKDNFVNPKIPLFTEPDYKKIEEWLTKIEKLYSSTAEELAEVFSSSIEKIKLNELSFANCSMKDVFCMLFHIGYSYVTDSLVEQEILSDFPKEITDSWGMWIWNK